MIGPKEPHPTKPRISWLAPGCCYVRYPSNGMAGGISFRDACCLAVTYTLRESLESALTDLLKQDANQFLLHGDARILEVIKNVIEPFNHALRERGRLIAEMAVADMNDPNTIKARQEGRIALPIYLKWERSK